jgi:Flp pilus assembly protein TadB
MVYLCVLIVWLILPTGMLPDVTQVWIVEPVTLCRLVLPTNQEDQLSYQEKILSVEEFAHDKD